jgi:hypothetical protein
MFYRFPFIYSSNNECNYIDKYEVNYDNVSDHGLMLL